MLLNALSGFTLFLSMIVVVGPQNAFVLRQGIRGEYVLAVALTCALSDVVLVTVGVSSFGFIVASAAWIAVYLRIAGAVFLAAYGILSLRRAMVDTQVLQPADAPMGKFWPVVLTCLAFAWLNPLVYLDTIILFGSVSTGYQFPALFAVGAMLASFCFFLALGYGSRYLAPLFARPHAWRIFDVATAGIMFTVVARLIVIPS